jgi:hypothetical protein
MADDKPIVPAAAAVVPPVAAAVVPPAAVVAPIVPAVVPPPGEVKPAVVVPAVAAAPGEVKPAAAIPVVEQPAVVIPPATGAPEKYDLKLPDGSKDWLDETDVKSLETLARSKNLTNEQAQSVLVEQAEALAAQSAAFRAQTESDPTYGGDKLAETQRLARLALDRVRPAGTPHGDALRRVLAKTGYGNHVEVIGFLAELGKQMAEDQPPHSTRGGGPSATDAASKLYGTTK